MSGGAAVTPEMSSPKGLPEIPTRKQMQDCIPESLLHRSLLHSLWYTLLSCSMTLATAYAAYLTLPTPCLSLASVGAWSLYAIINGTIATGIWVIGHECGHHAFCSNDSISDVVGFVLHSLLLVPFFSWQRSHSVHHSRVNHITEGETHVPMLKDDPGAQISTKLQSVLGDDAFTLWQLFTHLVLGWPLYLLLGVTGSPARGVSNHFVPTNTALFPGTWQQKVIASTVGVLAAISLLWQWVKVAGFAQVAALYGGPYLVVNAWLVLYTWLQHTDVDVPHFGDSTWSWIRGALATVDRPYPYVIDMLHHHIGSTHVLHHIDSKIPHYHAVEATNHLRKAFPQYCLFDPTPVSSALWRVARHCVMVEPSDIPDVWVYVKPGSKSGGKTTSPHPHS